MNEILLFLNQPPVLGALFVAAILLVLIDYLFPVDWPAYIGYLLFGVFIGATVPLSPLFSLLTIVAVFSLMLTLHKAIFSRYLTNLPRYELRRDGLQASRSGDISESAVNEPSKETPNAVH